jgi:hypothetical protein
MWPYSSYPERRPEDVEGRTYDYIVVGGEQLLVLDEPIFDATLC